MHSGNNSPQRHLIVSVSYLAVSLATCMGFGVAFAGEPAVVSTVNYPLAYFAERIGGDAVRVHFPAPADGDPASWSPAEDDVGDFRASDLILLNGAGYAGWIESAALPQDRLINTSAGFTDQYVSESEVKHSHGRGGEHGHEAGIAFTTWLDPQLALAQAAAIRDALTALQPAAAEEFAAGYESLRTDLETLDRDLADVFAALGDTPVVFSHPVYQYLQRRYSVNAVSVHWEPDEAPGDKEIVQLADAMLQHPAEIMIWEGQPEPAGIAALDEWGIQSVVLDPCGNRPEQGDYLSVMRANVANLRALTAN